MIENIVKLEVTLGRDLNVNKNIYTQQYDGLLNVL